jgi:AcrR family transcriptional regulator
VHPRPPDYSVNFLTLITPTLTESPPSVTDGVFFSDPGPLPRGRHGMSREQVRAAQRDRLLIAVTELLAAHGYRGFGPGEIASRAGVSLAAFYELFENKEACVFAGYDRFIDVLLTRMAALDETRKERATLTKEIVRTYLETLASDLVVARAYQVEIDALGPPARERRRNALNAFAAYFRELGERVSPGARELPLSAFIGAVYAARQLASDALDAEDSPDLEALAADLEIWMSDLFR